MRRLDILKIAVRVAQQDDITPEESTGQYGGKGPFNLPDDHIAAMQVPKGGSCCANCSFVDAENHACTEPNYIAWNGGDGALPELELDEICSDWYTPGAAPEPPVEEQYQL